MTEKKRDLSAEVEDALGVWASGAAVGNMASSLLHARKGQKSREVLRSRLEKLGEGLGIKNFTEVVFGNSGGKMPAAVPAVLPDGDSDSWWQGALRGDAGSVVRKFQGGVLLGFSAHVRGETFSLSCTVDQALEPRVLVVDPSTPDGLVTLRFGDTRSVVGDGCPISMFQPTMWANSAAMKRATSLAGGRLAAGEVVEIAGRLDEPGRFRAVLWCVGFDEAGQPLGAP